jgi:RNA-directed DNA polymerase
MNNFEGQISKGGHVKMMQGGVISTLLCNIALHGMEVDLLKNHGFSRDAVKIIRWADRFVITGKKLENVKKATLIVNEFLGTVKLKLCDKKSRLGHSLEPINDKLPIVHCPFNKKEPTRGKASLDFLGFYFRTQKKPIHRGVRVKGKTTRPFMQVSGPSLESLHDHKRALRTILRSHKSAPLEAVMAKLKVQIRE